MQGEDAESVVRRYFDEVVDGRNAQAVDSLFAADCIVMRADLGRPMIGREVVRRFVTGSIRAVPSVKTEIQSLVAGPAGEVAVRVRHEAQFGPVVITPIGPVLGLDRCRPVRWTAMAMFTVKDGLIAEEHVVRDELAILKDMGLSPRLRAMGCNAVWLSVRRVLGLGGDT